LYYSTTAGVTLNRQFPGHPDGLTKGGNRETAEHGKHVIIASEPSTYKDKEWNLIEKNHGVMVSASGDLEMIKMNC
jgi:glutamine amidotransferase